MSDGYARRVSTATSGGASPAGSEAGASSAAARRRGEPKITFGMIVLNGEPFVRYNLRALYPFAHEIIVVEGACPGARSCVRPDGHSLDGTLERLMQFRDEEDPLRKVAIVTAEDEGHPDGFWSEKDEMSQAYAERSTGNLLWQVDVDEFYRPEDMRDVIEMLGQDREITAVSFPMLTFWGGLDYRTDGFFLRRQAHDIRRIFAWGPGYRYVAHRPPTVVDDRGRDLSEISSVSAATLAKRGVFMYHYELVFPVQVARKCSYYAGASWLTGFEGIESWMRECYLSLMKPFRAHMVYQQLSWLERHSGSHPPEAISMVEAVRSGLHPGIELRRVDDVDALLRRPGYVVARSALRTLAWLDPIYRSWDCTIRNLLKRTPLRRVVYEARRLFHGAPPPSSDVHPITPDEVTGDLTDAWKDPRIPAAQRRIVDDELSRMYRGEIVPCYRALAEAMRATGAEHKQIVEVGCASGYCQEVLRHLLGHEIDYLGVDYSPDLIAQARRGYPRVPFTLGDATALPLADGACDVLISGCVLLHVPDYRTALAESARVSREWVILHRTPVVDGPTRYFTKLAYGVKCVEIAFSEAELLEIVAECGLAVTDEIVISRNSRPKLPGSEAVKTYVCRK